MPINGQTQGFSFTVTINDATPTAYCDVTTFTVNISNTGGASTFTGRIKFKTVEFRIIDNSELPNLVVTTGNFGGKTHFDFSTPSIPMGESVTYEYHLLATPYDAVDPTTIVEHFITRVVNSHELTANIGIGSVETEPIPQPGYSSVRISDILNDNWPLGTGPFALFPLEENANDDQYDTNPNKSQRIYVEDELICDIPAYSIYNGQETGLIVMEEGSTIIVEEGAGLYIDGQSISSCRNMWKGIYVKAGGRLILRDCIVANAQYGIYAERGATISCWNTVFQDCYIGLYVSPYAYAQDPEHPEDTYVNIEGFYGNLFIGSGSMKPGYPGQNPMPSGDLPYAGISVSNLSSFILPGDATSQSANSFENLHNGILVSNTSFSVGDVFFKDIEYDEEYAQAIQGYGIYIKDGKYSSITGNTLGSMAPYYYHFNNVHNGIYNSKGSINVSGMTMSNVNTGIQLDAVRNRTISIKENEIDGFYKGVLLNHCMPIGNGEVSDNYITISNTDNVLANHSACIEMNDYPVPTRWLIENNVLTIFDARYAVYNAAGYETTIMNNTIDKEYYEEDEGYGIYLLGTNSPVVTCNDITGDIDDPNFHNSTGIYFEASHEYNISCNEVDKFRYGIRPISANRGDLRGNILTDHYHGLYIGSGGRTGMQDRVGNIWNGIYEEEAAIHQGNTQDIASSQFFVDLESTTGYAPPSLFPASDWFIDEDGTPFECEISEVCPEGIGYYGRAVSWDSLDIDVVEGDLGFDDFNSSKSWNVRFHLYRRIHGKVVSALPSVITSFMTAQQHSNIGKFSNGYDSLFQAVKYEGPLSAILSQYPPDLLRIYQDVHYLDSLHETENYNADSLAVLLVAKYDSIFLYEYNYLKKDSTIQVVLNDKLENAENYIENITPDSSWQEQLQFTLLECLHLAKTDTLLSTALVYDLAMNCPDRYGDPVYHARSLIREDSMHLVYDDESECGFIDPRSLVYTSEKQGLIYPNPASSEIRIESFSSIKYVNVVAMSGSDLNLETQIFDNVVIFNVSILPPGVYHVKVVSNSGRIEVYKFVIVRG